MTIYKHRRSAVRALECEQKQHPDKELILLVYRNGTYEIVGMVWRTS